MNRSIELEVEHFVYVTATAESALLRLSARWAAGASVEPTPPALVVRANGTQRRLTPLPGPAPAAAAAGPAPQLWRAAYAVPNALVEVAGT